MADRVAADVTAALDAAGIEAAVDQPWSRIVLRTDRPAAAAQVAATIPGVGFARPAIATDARLQSVVDAARRLADARHGSGETYAVDSDRIGPEDAHDFSNREVKREVGRVIGEVTGAAVDLDAPDRTYRIEVRDEAFISGRRFDGPGGLPVGSQGRVATLVSGGIDSPVAAWRLLRRGFAVVPVYFDLGDYGGADHRARAIQAVDTLSARAPRTDLRPHVIDGGPLVARVVAATDDTRMVSLRRVMLAAADGVADRADAHSLATGEAAGQKSSQTGANLAVTDAAASRPVHRPLLAADKADIVAAARALGTYDGSTVPVGCERIAPPHPETNATRAAIVAAEPDDLLDAARQAGRDADVIPIERTSPDD
jgi:thiamine biosynthesis protein ThiI